MNLCTECVYYTYFPITVYRIKESHECNNIVLRENKKHPVTGIPEYVDCFGIREKCIEKCEFFCER